MIFKEFTCYTSVTVNQFCKQNQNDNKHLYKETLTHLLHFEHTFIGMAAMPLLCNRLCNSILLNRFNLPRFKCTLLLLSKVCENIIKYQKYIEKQYMVNLETRCMPVMGGGVLCVRTLPNCRYCKESNHTLFL